MSAISSLLSPPNLILHSSIKSIKSLSKPSLQLFSPTQFQGICKSSSSYPISNSRHSQTIFAVAEETSVATSSEAARRLYIGNIPRTLTNEELTRIVEEHGAVEKTEVIDRPFWPYYYFFFVIV